MMLVELRTPLAENEVRALRVGDQVSLSGVVFTMRDQATLRLLGLARDGRELPVELAGGVVYHAGPAVGRKGARPSIISVGPTTSARMNSVMPEMIRRLGIRLVVGKGGMDSLVLEAMGRLGCAYASAIGGCSALYTRSVKRVRRVVWEEMGPEAIYELEVKQMRPLTVTMDTHGDSLHARVEEAARERLQRMLGRPQE